MNMEAAIIEILERKLRRSRQKDDSFCYEIELNHYHKMDDKLAAEILSHREPWSVFYDVLNNWYMGCKDQLQDKLQSEVRNELTADNGPYPNGFTNDEMDEFRELTLRLVHFSLPAEYYLKQSFSVNIMLDTGDGNYDFHLNCGYPCWYKERNGEISDEAGILWLAKSQGYRKSRFQQAMRKDCVGKPTGFLQSVRSEFANLSSHMSTVTFLVKMTLREMIELNQMIHLQDKNGKHYNARENPYCGYIVVNKDTVTGLFDPWHGAGSCFGIELKKNVRIPAKYIRSALPDGGDGYSVSSVCGMPESAWQQGVLNLFTHRKK